MYLIYIYTIYILKYRYCFLSLFFISQAFSKLYEFDCQVVNVNELKKVFVSKTDWKISLSMNKFK